MKLHSRDSLVGIGSLGGNDSHGARSSNDKHPGRNITSLICCCVDPDQLVWKVEGGSMVANGGH